MNTTPSTSTFWKHVAKGGDNDCWEWQGTRLRRGYGHTWYNGRTMGAHRASWLIHNGPIPANMEVCHHCDNPPCVNPHHLYIATHAQNMADASARGRIRTAPPKVHGAYTHPESRVRGARNGQAKLTTEQVAEIRTLYSNGQHSQRQLAQQFNVGKGTIWRIVTNQSW
jgi:hypothetical protein